MSEALFGLIVTLTFTLDADPVIEAQGRDGARQHDSLYAAIVQRLKTGSRSRSIQTKRRRFADQSANRRHYAAVQIRDQRFVLKCRRLP
jgi:hypothetical protein